jgi:DNA-binding beta-propeller fold protein YncE
MSSEFQPQSFVQSPVASSLVTRRVVRFGQSVCGLALLAGLAGCGDESAISTADAGKAPTKPVPASKADGGTNVVVDAGTLAVSPVNPPSAPTDVDAELLDRAYIVNRDSSNLVVIDLSELEVIANLDTGGAAQHMADVSADFARVVIDSSDTDEAVVVDARKFEVIGRVNIGKHPTHLSLAPSGVFAIMEEDDNSVAFFDPDTMEVVARIGGPDSDAFATPHFMHFDEEAKFGYVANISGYHITRVNLETFEVDSKISLTGYADMKPGQAVVESGFADAQIDANGLLYAAHAATGRVLVYDTRAHEVVKELQVGSRPWVAFASRHFQDPVTRHLVPNFGDATVSLIDGTTRSPEVFGNVRGDVESYGVNFSNLVPDKAFVMNRVGRTVSVVDSIEGKLLRQIDVGGNVEIASTTRDGKMIIAAVSNANKVVAIDAVTEEILKEIPIPGEYPWSVTIPLGQNYCH